MMSSEMKQATMRPALAMDNPSIAQFDTGTIRILSHDQKPDENICTHTEVELGGTLYQIHTFVIFSISFYKEAGHLYCIDSNDYTRTYLVITCKVKSLCCMGFGLYLYTFISNEYLRHIQKKEFNIRKH